CPASEALINSPMQLECPWCGCGWLFTCINCRKAFTFAEAFETDESLESIGRRSLINMSRGGRDPEEELRGWVAAMKVMLRDVHAGRRYVYLDGFYLPTDEGIVLTGWAAQHAFGRLPHVVALHDPSFLEATLGDRAYWQKQAAVS